MEDETPDLKERFRVCTSTMKGRNEKLPRDNGNPILGPLNQPVCISTGLDQGGEDRSCSRRSRRTGDGRSVRLDAYEGFVSYGEVGPGNEWDERRTSRKRGEV